jgi:eukaryotic-like serine/threonine-protein kinase
MTRSLLPRRYVRLELIASGGMGEVYRASDSLLSRTVAVKVLAERHARDLDVRERFTREARAAARLSAHPNVVTVFDVGAHDGRPFIVMEYLSGGSVHDRLRAGRIEPSRALDWLTEAARGLDAAHASGVVHRDVKPANLMLDENEQVHVTDFGIASAAGFDTMTLPGTVLGTAGYLSPEQARGEPATAASDRYALGVVAFELLSGRRPFASDTPVTEAFAHMNADVPSVRTVAPELPAAVDAVLQRALAKDPAQRPESGAELVENLRGAFEEAEDRTLVLAAAPATAATAPPPAPRREHGRTWRWPVLLLAALAILLAGGASAALLAGGDDPPAQTITREVVTTVSDTASTLTVTETTTVPEETTDPEELPADSPEAGAALNNEAFALMQEGDFETALPLLERAVQALSGVGSLDEAYASYNLALTRFTLGRCDGVLELLDRSEAVQGERREIDRLRRDAERQCDGDGNPGKGRGNDGDDD